MKLKGTERQIKLAEEIIVDSKATIEINIKTTQERLGKFGKIDTLVDNLQIWEKIKTDYEKAVAKIDDAAFIIQKKSYLDADAVIAKFNELSLKSQYKKHNW